MSNIVRSGGKKWLLAVALCALLSCKQETVPEGILTRPQMVKALIDVYIAEEKATRLGLDHDSTVQIFDSLKVRLFTRIDLTDTIFRRSIAYYSDRPKDMEKIYSAVVDSLQLREQKAVGIKVAE